MKFSELSGYLAKLESTSSRIEITEILADLFKRSSADEIANVVYLILGSLAPSYAGKVFNIAEQMMVRALASVYEKELGEVKRMYKAKGDIGIVAETLAKFSIFNFQFSNYSVNEIHKELLRIATLEGEGSQDEKVEGIAKLLSQVDPLSARFIARIPVGKLRLGFSDKTVIDGLSWMVRGDKSVKGEIEAAYRVLPDVGSLAVEIKKNGVKDLSKRVSPKVGIPVMPMLAQRLKSPDEMIKKMGKVAVEPKFDGLRIFIHYGRKTKNRPETIQVYTRNMNFIDINTFPELLGVGKCFSDKVKNVILDTEAVGMDEKREKFVDFQKTIQRRRKHEIKENASETPLQFQAFDILLLNDKSLLNKSYVDRREILESSIKKGNRLLRVDESTLTTDPDEIRRLHSEYLKRGLEGVMVKKADGYYVHGRTGWRWVKMKEVEGAHGKLSDTVDAVVMGYTQGKGKRASFGIGQFLVGVPQDKKLLTISKVGTGLTDEMFRKLSKRLRDLVIKEKPKKYEVTKDLTPDFWVKPEVVVELAADEITVSPPNKHTAGYALRFPRLIKFRDDKSPKQATTLRELKDLFKLQKG